MIQLKSEQSLNNFIQICAQFFRNYTQTIAHFFQNAEIYLPPHEKWDFNNLPNLLKNLLMSYQNEGFWFLFDDKYLGKISIHNAFFHNVNEELVPAKILSIHELQLENHFGLLNQRKIGVLSFMYLKKYKNYLKYTPEPVYHTLFFDILTGLKIWEYTSHSFDSNPQTFYTDFKNYFLNYKDDALKLRCQFISLKSPIKEFPLERIIKNLINPIHYANSEQQKEILEKLNSVFHEENIQIIYDETHQTILFDKYPNGNENKTHQVIAIDSVSAQIQDYHHKIDFLFEKNELLPIVHSRLKELEIVYKNDCYLSTIVIIGSLLEALLKNQLLELGDNYYKLKNLPKDTKDNTFFKPVKVLNFKEMLDIYDNNPILSKTIVNLIDSYRDFRNQIHVYHDDSKNSMMNNDICEIGFRVLKMLINELYEKKQKVKV